MTLSDLYVEARRLIIAKGRAKGEYVSARGGFSVEAAIIHAAGQLHIYHEDGRPWGHYRPDNSYAGRADEAMWFFIAITGITSPSGRHTPESIIAEWQDRQTKPEVLKALQAARAAALQTEGKAA